VAGPAVCSAAAVSASEYMAAAACSRVNGSDSAAAGAVGGHLCAVAAQDRREDVDCGGGMGGLGRQDAVGVGFGGGKVDVVSVFAAGARDVELLAGEPIGADDVAGAFDVAPRRRVMPWALSMVLA